MVLNANIRRYSLRETTRIYINRLLSVFGFIINRNVSPQRKIIDYQRK